MLTADFDNTGMDENYQIDEFFKGSIQELMKDKIDTLLKLLEIYEIRKLIIQRNYAHGRKDGKSNEIRKNLIKDMRQIP